ncbi:MAG: glutathione peroxidase [Halieaceae bacterium]|jgi:glutathione peroxidase|nr:glutathione peroxidase [Halieaceae bacterium]
MSFNHRSIAALAAIVSSLGTSAFAACPEFLDHSMRRLHSSEDVNLCEVSGGKPMLIVNTASHCGYTPQFKGLEALHQKYREQGLVVMGFASDSFKQEADSEAEAADVCFVNYGVSFTMLAPTPVRGSDANPVFQALNRTAGEPSWNFNKYVVDADGNVVGHFGSTDTPDSAKLTAAIEKVL